MFKFGILKLGLTRFLLLICIVLAPILSQIVFKIFSLSSYNSLSGIAYKDAANWELCSKSLALYGEFPSNISDWCLRRPIHIEFVAILYDFFGSLYSLYFISSILFSITLYILFKYLNKLFTFLTTIAILCVSLFFWILFANNMMLSETSALILGNSAGIYLARIYLLANVLDVVVLVVILVVISLIRPGNLLIFTATIFLMFPYLIGLKNRLVFGIFVILIPVFYTITVKFVASLLGYSFYQTAGNSWATIYGLINNNSTWQQAYASIPAGIGNSEIAINEYLKDASKEEFVKNPFGIIKSMSENFYQMLSSVFPFFAPINIYVPSSFQIFIFITQLILILLLVQKLLKSTIPMRFKLFSGLVFISSILFYAASWKSEAARALSPTFTILTITLALFTCKIRNLNASSEKHSEFQKNRVHSLVLLKVAAVIITPLVLISSAIFLNHSPRSTLDNISADCRNESFKFDYESVLIRDIDSIRTFGAFGWSELVDTLPQGILIQGLAISDNEIHSYTVFLPDQKTLDETSLNLTCFDFNNESNNEEVLKQLNFREVIVV